MKILKWLNNLIIVCLLAAGPAYAQHQSANTGAEVDAAIDQVQAAKTSSAGAADSGKLLELDASGLLDDSFLPAAITRDAEWDTIGEIETATGVDILVDTEIDTEAEFEALLFGVFTPLDGALNDDDVTDDNVESMATTGAAGAAPVSDGASGLSMTDIATQSEQNALQTDDLWTLTNLTIGDVNFGTFTGSTISDSNTLKPILQELETAVEGVGGGHDAVTLAADIDAILGLSTQELSLDTQSANTVFAGPASGADADPTFRALVADDIPDLSGTYEPAGVVASDITDASANGQSILTAADYAAMRDLLNVEVGTDVQAYAVNLSEWAGVDPSTDAKTFIESADSSAMRTSLDVYSTSEADAADADTTYAAGTGIDLTTGTFSLSFLGLESLTDPDAGRYIMWDDAAGNLIWDAGLTELDSLDDVTGYGSANYLLQDDGDGTYSFTNSISVSSFALPNGTDAAPTAEGSTYWNSSTDTLTIGNGTNALDIGGIFGVDTGNSYTNYGAAGDDTIDELFAAIDDSWPSDSGAPTDAPYITSAADATLSNESVLSDEASLYGLLSDVTDFVQPGELDYYTDADIDGTETAFDGWDKDASDDFSGSYNDLTNVPSECETFTVSEPDQQANDIVLKHFMAEAYPSGVTITDIVISCSAAASDTHTLEEWDDRAGTTQTTIEAITLDAIQRQEDDGTLTDGSLAADSYLALNKDAATDDLSYLEVTIVYTRN